MGRLPLPRRWAPWVAPAAWTVLLTAAMLVGRLTRIDGASISVVWPAAGVTTAWLLMVTGRRAVLVGTWMALLALAVNVATGVDLSASAVFGLANSAHAVVAVVVLRRFGWKGPQPVRGLRDVLALMSASAASAALSGSVLAVLADRRLGTAFTEALPLLLTRNAVSTFVVTAALAALVARDRCPYDRGSARTPERVAMVSAAALAPLLLMRLPGEVPLTFLLAPVVILAAVRVGPVLTSCLMALQGAFVAVATMAGRGPFGNVQDASTRVLLAQALVGVIAVIGLSLAASERARAAALHEAASSRDALQAVTDAALVGQATLLVSPSCTTVQDVNPALCALLGRDARDLVGQQWDLLVDASSAGAWRGAADGFVDGGPRSWHGELMLRTAAGTVCAEAALAVVHGAEGACTVTAQLLDITARRRAEQRLEYLALHDDLTGLANRAMWHERVAAALAREDGSSSGVGVLYVDLDRFKAVNDTYGHATGDEVLVEVGRRLQAAVRPQDTVARLGGDEFVVVCPDIPDPAALQSLGLRLHACLAADVQLERVVLPLRASIGTSFTRPGRRDVRTLLGEADAALHRAKTHGRDGLVAYRADDGEPGAQRRRLLNELNLAVSRDELVLHYQPVLDLQTGRAVSVEALLRWQHPERGLLPPSAFLDALESSPLLHDVGLRMLRRALCDIGGASDTLAVNVNVSAEELGHSGVARRVGTVLRESGLAPGRLVLEITETRLLAVSGALLDDLRELRELGVRLAADDFGTGYSALSHLVELPVDVLKIDRSFVAAMTTDVRAHTVAGGVVAMASALGLECVAEGVELQEQADQLKALGCRYAQGYLWARALPLPALEAWLGGVPAPRAGDASSPRTLRSTGTSRA